MQQSVELKYVFSLTRIYDFKKFHRIKCRGKGDRMMGQQSGRGGYRKVRNWGRGVWYTTFELLLRFLVVKAFMIITLSHGCQLPLDRLHVLQDGFSSLLLSFSR